MQKIKWDGKQKQVNYQLQILLSEMGFFPKQKTKKTKIKSKTLKKTKQKTEPKIPEFIDLHLEIISKIDEVIKKNEQQNINKEEPTEETTLTQIRKPWTRKPIKPLFRTENIQDNNENNTLFEVERNLSFNQNIQTNNPTPFSNNIISIDEPLTVENINFVEKIDDNPNLLKGLGLSDRNANETTTKQKVMDVKIAKTDLEKTKQELERKKHELEEMMILAKEKEEELKKKIEEEKKLEKLKEIKQKELEKENRKKEKQRLLEQKRQEKINKIKQKALEKENRIKEKQRLLEQKKQEKIKEIKEKKLQKEQEIYKKQKEKEEKQKLLEKQEKIEEIINKKLKEKQNFLSEQNKIENIELKNQDQEEKTESVIEIKTKKKDKKIKPDYNTEDFLDEELGEALKIIDNLLEKLPEDTIYEFIHSKDFEIYERVVNKYSKK